MRVTIDIDTKNPLEFFKVFFRGVLLLKRLPYIEESNRGYHFIWNGLNITDREMFKYRLLIGDDENRVRLDMISDKRIKQVLFTEKRTIPLVMK